MARKGLYLILIKVTDVKPAANNHIKWGKMKAFLIKSAKRLFTSTTPVQCVIQNVSLKNQAREPNKRGTNRQRKCQIIIMHT